MRLIDILGSGDSTPDPVPDTFRPAPTPQSVPDPQDGPLLPRAQPRPAERPRPVFAPQKPAPRRYERRSGSTIGERAAEAWHKSHGGSRIEIPIGTVAALALLPYQGQDVPTMADWLMGLSDKELWKLYEETWAFHWINRPDLIDRASVLARWLEEEKPGGDVVRGVRAVTHAVLKCGLLEYTASDIIGLRADTDLMSWTLTNLRSEGAGKALAEVHTPPALCDLLARMTYGNGSDITPGMAFYEPAAGTGGMFRSLANHIRDLGHNPHDFTWHMTDIDPLAAACAAVNVLLWDLGPTAYVSCGDSLADRELPRKAEQHAAAGRAHRDHMVQSAHLIAAVGRAERLLNQVTGSTP
ncbi:N-6 DNA methylase [Streptomyces sp. NPDC091278]|uniref:N-6 DNA methylase n=1 Tax=Streptomyces sp. NPDC091278 TaxID=3155301 RepID=UPI00344C3C8B